MDECPICLDDLDESSPALGCGHRCHAHCLGQLAHALGSTPTRRGTKLSCPTCRRESRVAICAPHTAEFSVGDAVLGLWGHRWFPGVVDAVIDGGRAYEIAYDDGDHAEVTANHCRRRRDPATPAPDDDNEAGEDDEARAMAEDHAAIRSAYDEEQSDASASDGEETVVYVEWRAPRYRGIQWDSGRHKWMARYKNPKTGERVIVGHYNDDIEAARAHDAAVRATGLVAPATYVFPNQPKNIRKGRGRNPYIGVVWDADSKKYKAEYEDSNGDSQHIGDFDDAVKAAETYNATIRREGLASTRELNPLNYDGVPIPREECLRSGAARARFRNGTRGTCPDGFGVNRESNGILIPLPPEEPHFNRSEVVPPIRSGKPNAVSQYLGVVWNAEPPRWTARFSTTGRSGCFSGDRGTYIIDHFRTEEEAALAYNAAIRRYGLESIHKTNPVVNGALVPRPQRGLVVTQRTMSLRQRSPALKRRTSITRTTAAQRRRIEWEWKPPASLTKADVMMMSVHGKNGLSAALSARGQPRRFGEKQRDLQKRLLEVLGLDATDGARESVE